MTDYLQWQSDLSLEQVFAAGESFAYPTPIRSADNKTKPLLYLSTLKQENSRSALMLQLGEARHCITPTAFSLRTKISEYGGKPFWLFGEDLYFANQKDQCLYHQTLARDHQTLEQGGASSPTRVSCLSDQDSYYMYADVQQLDARYLLAVVEEAKIEAAGTESERNKQVENSSWIGLIDTHQIDAPPLMLVDGSDFYGNLVVGPVVDKGDKGRCRSVAWVQWQHPSMPWDDTDLLVAELVISSDGGWQLAQQLSWQVRETQTLDLGARASVCQLMFASTGDLYFVADFKTTPAASPERTPADNYWNLHVFSPATNALKRVTELEMEFGYPHWQYGDHRLVQVSEDSLLAIGSAPEQDTLYEIDVHSQSVREVAQQTAYQSLASDGAGRALLIELHADSNPALVELTVGEYSANVLLQNETSISAVSRAQHHRFDARDGGQSHGFYYPPVNAAYSSEAGTQKPPLIVMVHGGPTARAYGYFDLQKQFWTSRGFAIFDVNHRGSSGYGRAYRDALYGQWGEIDASDIVDGISYLVGKGLADPQRVCIRGKSAGGYAVLRALTEYPDVFRAGACYYGIGNLTTLAETTHKFEKHYTDRLIGEAYHPDLAQGQQSQFFQRSPIHKIANVRSAMIIFQGLQDNVVPPALAREVVAVLKEAGVEHSYVEYADEGHGFRQVANNVDAWTKELAFYLHVLALT